jgi:hypothetical protein
LAGGCSSTRHGLSFLARLSSLALRMSTFIGVTYGFRSHLLPGRGTSAYGTSSSCGSSPPCSHLVHSVRGRTDLASGPSLPDTTRRAKSTAGGISSNTLSSSKDTKPVCLPSQAEARGLWKFGARRLWPRNGQERRGRGGTPRSGP